MFNICYSLCQETTCCLGRGCSQLSNRSFPRRSVRLPRCCQGQGGRKQGLWCSLPMCDEKGGLCQGSCRVLLPPALLFPWRRTKTQFWNVHQEPAAGGSTWHWGFLKNKRRMPSSQRGVWLWLVLESSYSFWLEEKTFILHLFFCVSSLRRARHLLTIFCRLVPNMHSLLQPRLGVSHRCTAETSCPGLDFPSALVLISLGKGWCLSRLECRPDQDQQIINNGKQHHDHSLDVTYPEMGSRWGLWISSTCCGECSFNTLISCCTAP